MHRTRAAFSVLVGLVFVLISSSAPAQVVPPPPDPGIALVPSMVDSLGEDADGDGQISCGDQITYVVHFGETTTSEDLDFRDVRVEISIPTEVATVVPGTLIAFNPDDNPQATSTSDLIQVFMGRVCRTPTCNSPAAAFSFRLELLEPNLVSSLALQGIVTGSNTPNSVTDDPDTSDPVDATVTTFASCTPEPLVSSDLTDLLEVDRDGDGLADPGDVLRFTHTVVNSSVADADAQDVFYTLPTLAGLEILPSSVDLTLGSVVSVGSSDLRVSIPTLPRGSHSTLRFDARIESPTPLLQTEAQFRISGSNFQPRLSNDPATTSVFGDPTRTPIDRDPDLALALSVSPTVARPGTELTYTAAVTNLSVPSARGSVLTFTVPPETQVVPGASDPLTCAPDTTAGATCEMPLGSVASGDSILRRFTLAIDPGVPATFNGVTTTAVVADDGSEGPDPDPSNNTATVEALTDQVTLGPDLTLDKDDSGATATPGEMVSYDLRWSNQGNQDASRVDITDSVPRNATFEPGSSSSGWSCSPDASAGSMCRLSLGDVAVGEAGTVRFAIRVASQIPAGVTALTNTATIDHDGTANDDLDPSDNTDTEITPLSSSAGPDLRLTKTSSTPTAVPGELLSYTLVVANQGNRGATGVRIVESIPLHTTFDAGASDGRWSCGVDSCTLDLATLPAGGEETLVFVARVDSTLPAGVSSIANSAVAQDDGTNGDDLDPGDNEDTEEVPVDPSAAPDLGVEKTARAASVSPGELLVFDVTVTNSGNRAAAGVTLTETVPSETAFEASASDPGWDCADQAPAGTVCTLLVPELAAGAAEVSEFAVRVSQALPAGVLVLSNTVRVDDDGANGDDPNPDDDSDTEDVPIDGASPDLSVEKTSRSLTVRPGDLLTYTVVYGNEGTREATRVRLLEIVPERTTFVEAQSDPGWSCTGTTPGSSCELLVGSLPVDASGEALFTVRVDPELPAGTSSISNSVAIDHDPEDGDDPDPGDDEDVETTPIDPSAGPDLALTKSDSGVVVQPGDLLTYTLRITQTGNRGAAGVVLTETLPEHTELVDSATAPDNAPWQCLGGGVGGDVCTLAVGEMPVGAERTVGLTLRVASSVPAAVTGLVNRARVDDDGTHGADLDPTNNSALESTPLDVSPDGGPDLSVVKSDSGLVARPGDEILYQIHLRNDGNQPASGIVVTETVPEHTVFVAALSSPAWDCPAGAPAQTSCQLEVPSLDPGGLQVLRFAVRLSPDLPDGVTQVDNTVSVTDDGSHGPDLDPTNNTDAETTPVRLPDQRREVDATLDDLITTDVDGDGLADVDDVVTYVGQITHRGSSPVTDLRVLIQPDPHTSLLGGSVFVDLPADIVTGGEFRDSRVDVVLARLEPGQTAEVRFDAQVVALPQAVQHLSVQGEVLLGELSLVTDDPMTAAPDDPTRTPTDSVQVVPIDVPTLGQWALILLALGLGLAAFHHLRI